MFKRFLPYYKPYKKVLLFTILGSILVSLLELVFPLVVRYVLNEIIPTKDLHNLFIYAVGLLVLYVAGYAIPIALTIKGGLWALA